MFFSPFARKIFSLGVLVSFLATSLSWASLPEIPVEFRLEIPPELGRVDELRVPDPAGKFPLVIHIQTLHAHYETAVRVRDLIRFLADRYGIRAVFAEGASRRLNPEYLKFVPEAARNEAVIDALARKAELTGVDLAAGRGIRAEGVEDASLYRRAYGHFKSAMRDLPKGLASCEKERRRLDREASRIFDGGLRDLTGAWLKFQARETNFLATFRFLRKQARESLGEDLDDPFSQFDWPHLARLAVLDSLEKKTDEKEFRREQERLGAWRREKNVSLAPDGAGPPRKQWEDFLEKAVPLGFEMRDYPQTVYRRAFQVLREEIQAGPLHEEMERLFSKLLRTAADTAEKKELIEKYRGLMLSRKLLRLELTPAEWKELTAAGAAPQGARSEAVRFYRLMGRRDAAFLKNMGRLLNGGRGPRAVILVTGGFHSGHLKELLAARGAGYALVTPEVKGEIESSLYHRIMTRASHLEQTLFTQDPRVSLEEHGWDVRAQRDEVLRTLEGQGLRPAGEAPYFAAAAAALGAEDLKRGLEYEEAREWKEKAARGEDLFPRGFWRHEKTLRNMVFLALDSIPGFKAARLSGDAARMAERYRNHIRNFRPRDPEAFAYRGKNRKTGQPEKKYITGQTAFFYEQGLRTPLTSPSPLFGNKNARVIDLLRLAVPEIFEALDPLEVQINYWTVKENAIRHALLALDTLEGFPEARRAANVKAMAEIYRREVLKFRPRDPRRIPFNGQHAFFMERGGLMSFFHRPPPYMKKGNVAELLRMAVPGLVDDANPDALKTREVERPADIHPKLRKAKTAGLRTLRKFIAFHLPNMTVPAVSVSVIREWSKNLSEDEIREVLRGLGFEEIPDTAGDVFRVPRPPAAAANPDRLRDAGSLGSAPPQKVLLLTTDPPYGLAIFERLFRSPHDIVGVVTERSRREIIEAARRRGVPVIFVPDGFDLPDIDGRIARHSHFNSKMRRFMGKLRKLEPDIALTAYFDRIPKVMFDIPKKKFLNLHPAALPEFRGGFPLAAALLHGRREIGLTVHEVTEQFDRGAIVGQELQIPVEAEDNVLRLWMKTAPLAADLALRAVDDVAFGRAAPVPQNGEAVPAAFMKSRVRGVTLEDTMELDWPALTSEDIIRRARAWYYPYDGAYTYARGHRIHLEWAAALAPDGYAGAPGQILEVRANGSKPDYVVKTVDGAVLLHFRENHSWLKKYLLLPGKTLGTEPASSLGAALWPGEANYPVTLRDFFDVVPKVRKSRDLELGTYALAVYRGLVRNFEIYETLIREFDRLAGTHYSVDFALPLRDLKKELARRRPARDPAKVRFRPGEEYAAKSAVDQVKKAAKPVLDFRDGSMLDGMLTFLRNDKARVGNDAIQSVLDQISRIRWNNWRLVEHLLLLEEGENGGILNLKRDLNELMRDLIREIRAQYLRYFDVTDLVFEPGDLPRVMVDETRLKAALHEFILNAVQATVSRGGTTAYQPYREGAKVTVRTRYSPVRDRVEIQIEDNGIGLHRDEITRLRRFAYTQSHFEDGVHFGNKGLGVPLASIAVDDHRGVWQVESEPGAGTTLTVYFPRNLLAPGSSRLSFKPAEVKGEIGKAIAAAQHWPALPKIDREAVFQALDFAQRLAEEPALNRTGLLQNVSRLMERLARVPGVKLESAPYRLFEELRDYLEKMPGPGAAKIPSAGSLGGALNERAAAWHLLRELGLEKYAPAAPRPGNPFGARRITLPPGSSVLRSELAPVANFDLVYNAAGRLVAVFPVITGKEAVSLPPERMFYYLDLRPYDFEIPEANVPDAEAERAWRELARETERDGEVIEAYARTVAGSRMTAYPGTRQAPYVYAEVDAATGEMVLEEIDPARFSAKKFHRPKPGKHQIIFPVYPGVYSPAEETNSLTDRRYHAGLYVPAADLATERDPLQFQARDRVLVGFAGTGFDAWLAALALKRAGNPDPLVHAFDASPLAVANVKALARIAGFRVEARVHRGLVSPEGDPVFPGEQFDVFLANAPSIDRTARPAAETDAPESLRALWDGLPWEVMEQIIKDMPRIAAPKMRVWMWNAFVAERGLPDPVESALASAGFIVGKFAADPLVVLSHQGSLDYAGVSSRPVVRSIYRGTVSDSDGGPANPFVTFAQNLLLSAAAVSNGIDPAVVEEVSRRAREISAGNGNHLAAWAEAWERQAAGERDLTVKARELHLAFSSLTERREAWSRLRAGLSEIYVRARREDYRRAGGVVPDVKKVKIRWPGFPSIPAYLILPPGAKKAPVPAVIFVHGLFNSKEQPYLDLLERKLIARGVAVLRIDLPRHGDNTDLPRGPEHLTALVDRALGYLAKRPEIDGGKLGIFGFSFGGKTALRALADEKTGRKLRAAAVLNPPMRETLKSEMTLRVIRDYLEALFDEHTFGGLRAAMASFALTEKDFEHFPEHASKLLAVTAGESDSVIDAKDAVWLKELVTANGGRLIEDRTQDHYFFGAARETAFEEIADFLAGRLKSAGAEAGASLGAETEPGLAGPLMTLAEGKIPFVAAAGLGYMADPSWDAALTGRFRKFLGRAAESYHFGGKSRPEIERLAAALDKNVLEGPDRPVVFQVLLKALKNADRAAIAARFRGLPRGSVVIGYEDGRDLSGINLKSILPEGVEYLPRHFAGKLPVAAVRSDLARVLAKDPRLAGHQVFLFSGFDSLAGKGRKELEGLGFSLLLDAALLREQPRVLQSRIISAAAGDALEYAKLDPEARERALSEGTAAGFLTSAGNVHSLVFSAWLDFRASETLSSAA